MRLKTPASLINSGALEPMARMLLSNLRQGLDEETYVKVMGESADPRDFQLIKASKQDLVGNYDFVIFDCTLPSERAYQASVLKELMLGMIQNPEAAQIFGYGPDDLKYLLNTILDLQGVKAPPKQLPTVAPQPNMMQQGQPQTPGAPMLQPRAGGPPMLNPANPSPGPTGIPNLGAIIGGLTGPES